MDIKGIKRRMARVWIKRVTWCPRREQGLNGKGLKD
jgi:hypothetical protein